MVREQTRAASTAWAGIVTCAEGGGQQQVRRTSDTQTTTASRKRRLRALMKELLAGEIGPEA